MHIYIYNYIYTVYIHIYICIIIYTGFIYKGVFSLFGIPRTGPSLVLHHSCFYPSRQVDARSSICTVQLCGAHFDAKGS